VTLGETTTPPIRRARVGHRRPPIRRRLLHAEVGDRLRDMIVQGDIAAGGRRNESRLAEILDVSRTPIREALKQLASEGLVELLPGRGARVARLAPEAILELFEVISGLERHAVELASARMTRRELARLQTLHERMVLHHRQGRRPDYFRLNQEIHLGLVAAARNPTLKATHAILMAQAGGGRYIALMSPERWTGAVTEHEALMQALAARDATRAGQIMLQHVLRTGEVAAAALRDETSRAVPRGPVARPRPEA
jgi:DNA-binding GntR family transcriptional regulator